MLSWDEFDRELEEESENYSATYRRADKYVRDFAIDPNRDSAAVARAKAALDLLDIMEEPESLRCIRRNGTVVTITEDLSYGVYGFYDFRQDHFHQSALRDIFNRIVILFAAFLLSAIYCARASAALNAFLRTPLFAYDAELSIDRHRLRSAF
ncbi:hypothetical protein NLO88_15900 [Pseudomonas syringae]|uniref:hypothetical protein n=1 Tax=Pseudomonas quasicaspiana TaxID=2829821 RepID=UPI001E4A06F8|nr:hypothetical protein [Pseudomonas quasicaspiana]MCD5986784.1 hypothetical protein [Pseudomonas quasicaspiana]MCQ2997024.1 hypothetical protein [Pseudomonas syringae]MCQ3032145.1 hypothetical protein [Pseudomonas syringae]